jgi:hypothetical protein
MSNDFSSRAAQTVLVLIGFAGLATTAVLMSSCSRRHSLDFRPLVSADRIRIKDLTAQSDREFARIEDTAKIQYVLDFLERHKDGWTEPFGGPPIPQLMLEFYKDEKRLGGFGIDSERLIADPGTYGWWSLPLSSEERNDFLKQLGLTLPRSGKIQQ